MKSGLKIGAGPHPRQWLSLGRSRLSLRVVA